MWCLWKSYPRSFTILTIYCVYSFLISIYFEIFSISLKWSLFSIPVQLFMVMPNLPNRMRIICCNYEQSFTILITISTIFKLEAQHVKSCGPTHPWGLAMLTDLPTHACPATLIAPPIHASLWSLRVGPQAFYNMDCKVSTRKI